MLIELYFLKLEPSSKRLNAKLTKFKNEFIVENTTSYKNGVLDKNNISGEEASKSALAEVNKIIAAVSKVKI